MRALFAKIRSLDLLTWWWTVLVAVTVVLSLVMPTMRSQHQASPDETAVVVAIDFLAHGHRPFIVQPYAGLAPWVHPRSWVTLDEHIVPLGFLGLPLLLAPIRLLLPLSWLSLMTTLAWWLSVICLHSLLLTSLRKHCHEQSVRASARWSILLYAVTPMALLYANRSLFPQTTLIAVGLFAIWLWHRYSTTVTSLLAGLIMGLALSIRPIEAVWIVPWLIWLSWSRTKRHRWLAGLGCLLGFMPSLILQHLTYGNWWRIGYWIHEQAGSFVANVTAVNRIGWRLDQFMPYGFHPANIIWNVRAFSSSFLWPWLAMLIVALLYWIWLNHYRRPKIVWWRHEIVWLVSWSLVVVLSLYGSGLYQDHVRRGAVTVGNSFLRYLLPLTPLMVWPLAWLWDKSHRWGRSCLAPIVATAVVCFGFWSVTMKDDENIFATRRELQRYDAIANASLITLPLHTIVLSERSDKIFFPTWLAVSPLPSSSVINAWMHIAKLDRVAIFMRPPSQTQRDTWSSLGLEVLDIATFGRERLSWLVRRTYE